MISSPAAGVVRCASAARRGREIEFLFVRKVVIKKVVAVPARWGCACARCKRVGEGLGPAVESRRRVLAPGEAR